MGSLVTALAGIAFVRLALRFHRGERTLGWQLGFYVVFLLCVIEKCWWRTAWSISRHCSISASCWW